MRVYWDQAAVAVPAPDVALEPVALDPVRADLRERGFSAVATDGEPLGFDYARVSWLSPWKTMPGRYTREGDVRPLLAATDDAFVVSKPGDEVAVSFDASALPPVGAGRTRTFLLHGDGFSKEMDINSASPDIVLPLPYHGMKAYPYAEADAPPARAEGRRAGRGLEHAARGAADRADGAVRRIEGRDVARGIQSGGRPADLAHGGTRSE